MMERGNYATHRETFFVLACLASCTLKTAVQGEYNSKVSHGQQPNIIFMFIDDLGWNDVGFHGANYSTPNLDYLVTTGIELTNYYVESTCTPSRAALLTGQYPWRFGIQAPFNPATTEHLPVSQNISLLPQLLKDYNYTTYLFGKWHLGYASWNYTPIARGFDEFLGYFQGCGDYYYHNISGVGNFSDITGYDFWYGKSFDINFMEDHYGTIVDYTAIGEYSNDLFHKKAIKTIDKHAGYNSKNDSNNNINDANPFFMYLSWQTIHSPIELPPNDSDIYQNINASICQDINHLGRYSYCLKMLYLDYAVGNVINQVKENDIWDNTIIIISSDNGGLPLRDYNGTDIEPEDLDDVWAGYGSNTPYRGGKGTLFEGGVKGAAFIIGGKNVLPLRLQNKALKFNKLMHVIDWLPTIINGIIGASDDDDNNYNYNDNQTDIDGINMWPYITQLENMTTDACGGDYKCFVSDYSYNNNNNNNNVAIEGININSSIHNSVELNNRWDVLNLNIENANNSTFEMIMNDKNVDTRMLWLALSNDSFGIRSTGILWNDWKYIYGIPTLDAYYPPLPEKPYYLNNDSIDSNSTVKWLFDLRNDPLEINNVAHIYSNISEFFSLLRLYAIEKNRHQLGPQNDTLLEQGRATNLNGIWAPFL